MTGGEFIYIIVDPALGPMRVLRSGALEAYDRPLMWWRIAYRDMMSGRAGRYVPSSARVVL